MLDLDITYTDVQKHDTYNLTPFPTKVEFDFSFVICVYVLKLASRLQHILAVQGPA